MSGNLINGKFRKKFAGYSPPSPAEIAEKAYDRASAIAVKWADEYGLPHADRDVAKYLAEHKPTQLAELRDSVVNPPAIKGRR